jgi:hypothetical protein
VSCRRSGSSIRQTRSSAWQNASPAILDQCHGAQARLGLRGGGRLSVLSLSLITPTSIVCRIDDPDRRHIAPFFGVVHSLLLVLHLAHSASTILVILESCRCLSRSRFKSREGTLSFLSPHFKLVSAPGPWQSASSQVFPKKRVPFLRTRYNHSAMMGETLSFKAELVAEDGAWLQTVDIDVDSAIASNSFEIFL